MPAQIHASHQQMAVYEEKAEEGQKSTNAAANRRRYDCDFLNEWIATLNEWAPFLSECHCPWASGLCDYLERFAACRGRPAGDTDSLFLPGGTYPSYLFCLVPARAVSGALAVGGHLAAGALFRTAVLPFQFPDAVPPAAGLRQSRARGAAGFRRSALWTLRPGLALRAALYI